MIYNRNFPSALLVENVHFLIFPPTGFKTGKFTDKQRRCIKNCRFWSWSVDVGGQ